MQRALSVVLVLTAVSAAAWQAGSHLASADGQAPETKPGAEVLQGIRLLVSSDARESARGEAILKRLGISAAPQLRNWVRRSLTETERVRLLLESIEGKTPTSAPVERISANELFHRKLLEAQDLSRRGEHRKTLEISEAVLLLDPVNPYAWELRRLSRRSKERLASKDLLEPSIEAEKLVYEVGEEPQINFRLVNHRDSEAVVEVQKGILGEVEVSITVVLIDGGSRLRQTRLRLQAPPETTRIVIGPRKSWEHKVPFSLKDDVPLGGAVARVQIGGRFRPTDWRVDGSEAYGNLGLSISESELWIVPPGESPQSESPLEKLASAFLFKKEQPFFVGGQLAVWAAESDAHFNEKLIETLIGSIDDVDPPRLKLAVRFLREVTGEEIETDATKWKAWWARQGR